MAKESREERVETVYDNGFFIGFVSEKFYDKPKSNKRRITSLVVEVAPECYSNIKMTDNLEIK